MKNIKGGTRRIKLVAVVLLGFVTVIGIAVYMELQAFQSYKVRTTVIEAFGIGRSASVSVGDYYVQNKKFPASLEEAGVTTSPTKNIRGFNFDAKTGTISVIMARPPNDGKSLLMVPSVSPESVVTWKCESEEIAQQHLPLVCRK
jgi:hypothetical protein